MGIKYKINKEFFKKWSPNMAYVLGYIYADGCLINCDYIRAYYLTIVSTDKDSLERIKNMMGSEHKIGSKKSLYKNGKRIFQIKIGSKEIYTDLINLGLYPRKSLSINFPNIPNRFINHFIRGYFDGDGCVYFEKTKSRTGKIIIKRIRVIFTSGSKVFLEQMNKKMSDFYINEGKIYNSKRSFQLVFNNKDSINVFKMLYKGASNNSFFMRKFKIFDEYFQRRLHIDKEIKNILRSQIKAWW